MKKILYLLLAMILFQGLYAQKSNSDGKKKKKTDNPWYFSIQGHLNTITGESSWDPRFGFQGEVGVRVIDFTNFFGLNLGVGYSMQGAKWSDMGYSGHTSLGYLIVPVIAHYQHPKGFYAEAGLQPGFLLSAKEKFDSQSYDIKDNTKGFDLGIPFGIGYRFQDRFAIGVRATPGLGNIYKNSSDGTAHNLTIGARFSVLF